MEFFTTGNLITIGIVLLVLILYRQMDRSSRNLKLLRDYAEKLKKELAVFVEEQEKAVKDYGISLNVERDAARELLKHLQMTEDEMAEKAQAVARIDTQIKAYENSLAELDRLTSRVQENMNRVREESAFVEAAGKKIGDAKARLDDIDQNLGNLENRFERENAVSLERTAEAVISSVRSAVSDLTASAETIERQVEDHRQEINRIEAARADTIARDEEQIDSLLNNAIEKAGMRADKMEEAAMAKLKSQAEERMLRYKTAEEEKLKSFQENAKARVTEVQNLLKIIRDEWRTERTEWETKDKEYREERKKELAEISALFEDSEKRFSTSYESLEKRMVELNSRADGIITSQEALLLKNAEDMKQKALEITGAKLEEYRHAQDLEFKRLESLADDSRNLDAELRRSMQEVITKVREDFTRYERESSEKRKVETDKFLGSAAGLKEEMARLEKELAVLKSAAYENVSEKLKIFEDEFFADLSKRSSEIDQRLLSWQESVEKRLGEIAQESQSERSELERNFTEEMRKNLTTQDQRIVSDLEHLKAETGAFEDGIRVQMTSTDDAVSSYKQQLDSSLEEARNDAELSIKSEIGKYAITSTEAVKQYQRELDGKLREMSEYIQSRNGEISGLVDSSRSELDAAREGLAGKIKELDDTIEDARRRSRELAAETDNRIASVRSSVEDAERHIKEAVDQTKLLDRAEALKLDMERRIEDLRSDIARLDQRRAEAAQLENDFIKIKRLEDDVNAKMTRFLSEKRRIETMEADFNRLLQISRSVEEKLTQVTASDDTLQGIQLQIRKLEEALGTTEDKFQRMERKSKILDNTNDGIDKNFKTLQESEKISTKLGGDLDRYTEDLGSIKVSIEKLARESEKASEAVNRIDVLDNALEEIEERIKSMQAARQWLANAETRFEELNRNALLQARAIEAVSKGKKSGAPVDPGDGLPMARKKENVINLARQGWKVDEIAKANNMSRGEVELILEMAPRD